jgi:phospholipid/cholesterol/gamma-HCH transport system substrate-binding protein
MNRTGAEIRVGIIVVVALAILFLGIMWGKGYKIKAERYPRLVQFTTISGLENGARVLVSGVEKGKVDHIDLYPDRVEVRILLDKDVILYTDAKIYIDSPELMGGKVISIYPGSSGIHAPLDVPLKGSPALGMSEIITMAGDLREDVVVVLNNLNDALTSINASIGDSKTQENIRSSLAHLSQLSQKLNQVMEKSAPHITSAAEALDSSAQRVNTLLENRQQSINQTLDNIAEISVELKDLVKSVKDITQTIRQGEGTLGKLVYEPSLYQRLDSTLTNIDSLIAKFNREGIKTSVHLFGK